MEISHFFKHQFLSLFFILLCNTIKSQSLETKIDSILIKEFKANETGVSALVAKDGKIIYRKAFGKANLELDVDMTSENVFQVGSITKQFTAVSILMLLEEGKLSLEDEITKFIPNYPYKNKKITIHHLLTHTSGIKSYTSMRSFGKMATIDTSPLKFIDFFKNEPLDFNPGDAYLYNNSGYFILGYIIEKVSGIPYPNFIQERIFAKIGMNSSYFGSHKKMIKNRASGYSKNENGFVNAQYISMSLPYAAGSIMSTVDDMLKWQTAITNNTFVKNTTIEKAFTNYTLNNGDKINYGYGWSLDEINGVATIEHGGSIPGFLSMGVYIPSKNVYAVLFSNCSCKSTRDISLEIVALAIDKPLFKKEQIVSLTQEEKQKWIGTYKFDNKVYRYVYLKDKQLFSKREGSSQEFKIFPTSENSFSFEGGFISYEFSMIEGKKAVIFKNRIHKERGVFVKKKKPKEKKEIKVSTDLLKTYVGKFALNPDFIITITSKDDKLFAQATGQSQFQLFAESENKFFLKAVKASVEFHKNKKGEVYALTLYQGGRTMKAQKQ